MMGLPMDADAIGNFAPTGPDAASHTWSSTGAIFNEGWLPWTCHEYPIVAVAYPVAVAFKTIDPDPADDGVPVIVLVAGANEHPAGNPDAVKVTVGVPVEKVGAGNVVLTAAPVCHANGCNSFKYISLSDVTTVHSATE